MGDVAHASRGSVEVRINPGVAWVEPDTEMTVFAPRRSRWLNALEGWVSREVFARRRQTKVLFAGRFANATVKKEWPVEPPMDKYFGSKWHHEHQTETSSATFANLMSDHFANEHAVRLRRP